MAGLRPAKCYRKLERPNTRQSLRVPRRSYVKGVPAKKISLFEIGNKKTDFPLKVNLVSLRGVQIRHNALEAARLALNKSLTKALGEGNYIFKILVYPHHIMRENPLASGAGADRYQSGMRQSFGKPIGLAARVKENQNIVLVGAPAGKYREVKNALRIASGKLPTPCRIVTTAN